MAFQIPKAEQIAQIIKNSRPTTPLDLNQVVDADGNVLDESVAKKQIEEIILTELPAMSFPLLEELIFDKEALKGARINTVVRDGIVAGQMLEMRLYGVSSVDRYEAFHSIKVELEKWMPVLSHPVFGLGKATVSDRIDKELKGRSGKAKGSIYLQLAWSFDFIPHSELYDYKVKDAQSTPQSTPQAQAQAAQTENVAF